MINRYNYSRVGHCHVFQDVLYICLHLHPNPGYSKNTYICYMSNCFSCKLTLQLQMYVSLLFILHPSSFYQFFSCRPSLVISSKMEYVVIRINTRICMSPNTSQYYNLWWPKHMLLAPAQGATPCIFRNYISLSTIFLQIMLTPNMILNLELDDILVTAVAQLHNHHRSMQLLINLSSQVTDAR